MESKDIIPYGLGYVMEDKKEDSYEIIVYPISLLPTEDGELYFDKSGSLNIKNKDSESISVKYTKSSGISALWAPDGEQNRVTAPDVCTRDIVELFTVNDTDQFYWKVHSHNIALRKREKVLHFFSNKGEQTSTNAERYGYYYLVDTINKKISLHTADNDGELCTYDFGIDTLRGIVNFRDGFNNGFDIKSKKGDLTIDMNNSVTVNAPSITANCNSAIVNAKEKTDINTGVFTVKSDLTDINP